jgi:hypothetical protein
MIVALTEDRLRTEHLRAVSFVQQRRSGRVLATAVVPLERDR